MSKEKPMQETESKITRYYEKLQEINRLQNKLALLLKNKQAAQEGTEECNLQGKASGQVYEYLQQELSNLDLEIINTNVAIREIQREIIDTHYAIEQLQEEYRRFVELLYGVGASLPALAITFSMSNSAAYRRKAKILSSISAMLS